jgi:hypothetical protein
VYHALLQTVFLAAEFADGSTVPVSPAQCQISPIPVHKVEAEYTQSARKLGIRCDVTLKLHVDLDGKPGAVAVAKRCAESLGTTAADAKLAPVRADLSKKQADLEVLKGKEEWFRKQLRSADAADQLRLKARLSEIEGQTANLTNAIAKDSKKLSSLEESLAQARLRAWPKLLEASKDLDDEAATAVQQWRFRPGGQNGKPAVCPAQIEVSFMRF